MGLFGFLTTKQNEGQLKKVRKIADKVEALSEKYSSMSDEQLRACTDGFKKNLEEGMKLDDILPDAFACVRETASRVLNLRHFFVQVMGGIALHQRRIAEMATGEGKTLVATLPAYLNALTGKGVHIVTVNDYLAKRDAEWMGKIYTFLGLSVGVIVQGMSFEEKKAAYNCDIVYGTNNEFGFDYLRDNMAISLNDKVQRDLNYAIIDEVDSILIDEARTPLIISGRSDKSSQIYIQANNFAKRLTEGDDYEIDEKEKNVRLTEEGTAKAERFFNIENLSDVENSELYNHIHLALKANYIMKRDDQYIVNDGEIIIVDEFTGRMMIGRRFSDGLHQAIEAKEGVKIQGESKTYATITFQNYFRLYKKLAGMTGTAKTEENEFRNIYNLDVMVLPTNMPLQRKDENDKLYTTRKGKLNAVIADIESCYKKGQPVLVGTVTVEKSEELSELLRRKKIPHNVLNAKNHEKEAEIVAQAGKLGAVTIATNMAGRGTDIMLGGNPEHLALTKLEKSGYPHEILVQVTSFAKIDDEQVLKAKEEYKHYYELFKKQTDEEKAKVIEAGGLRIIGTERHESRRIDNQLRGRSGRQGDKGSTCFYISMEDDLIRVFGGDRMKRIAEFINIEDNVPIENKMLTSQVERAQRMLEDRNFSVRKHVLSYDNVMNRQRDIIYSERNKVLSGVDVHEQILKMADGVAEDIIAAHADFKADVSEWDYDGFNKALEEKLLPEESNVVTLKLADYGDINLIKKEVLDCAYKAYDKKIEEAKEQGIDFAEVERVVMLRCVDRNWIEHIDAMNTLRQGIGLRAYGHRDPVISYQQEGFEMFDHMIETIQEQTVTTLFKGIFKKQITHERKKAELSTNEDKVQTVRNKGDKIGRNDLCPCGSGKKYKNCCLNKN